MAEATKVKTNPIWPAAHAQVALLRVKAANQPTEARVIAWRDVAGVRPGSRGTG